MTEFVTHSEAETSSVGRGVAASLQPGDVLLLSGPLGAGKTAFVRGLEIRDRISTGLAFVCAVR